MFSHLLKPASRALPSRPSDQNQRAPFEKPLDFNQLKGVLTAQIESKPPEHRAHVRVRMRLALKLRGTDASGRKFEEMTTTENVSAGFFVQLHCTVETPGQEAI